jgi:hypothetical protein
LIQKWPSLLVKPLAIGSCKLPNEWRNGSINPCPVFTYQIGTASQAFF